MKWEIREVLTQELRNETGKVISKAQVVRLFWPRVRVVKGGGGIVEMKDLDDPEALRNEMFRWYETKGSEGAALDLLNRIGAWETETHVDPKVWTHAQGAVADVAYGHRLMFHLRVRETTLEEFSDALARWYKVLQSSGSLSRLKKHFLRAPGPDARLGDSILFAAEGSATNKSEVSLVWSEKDPRAVIETISGSEMFRALAWIDAVRQAPPQVCQECKTRFMADRKKKYCRWECGHAAAVRAYKRRKRDEKPSARKPA